MNSVPWNWIKMIDIYSTPIGFTYKNKFKIKTWFGGVLTIVTAILTVVYFCILIAKPIKLISLDSSFVSGLFGSGGTQGGTWNKTVKSYFVNKSNKRMTHLNQVDVQPYWNVAFIMSGGYDPTLVTINFIFIQYKLLFHILYCKRYKMIFLVLNFS